MKIVQINAVYAYSSTGRTTREMHEFLMREGHESYVFCSEKTEDAPNVSLIGTLFDHKLHGLLSRMTDRQGFFSKGATKKLIGSLNVILPDVVILRNLHGNYINVPMLLEWLGKNNIPTIIILHDCWFFTGHCCYYVEDNCDKWKSLCMSCPAKHKFNKSYFVDNSTSNFKIKQRLFSELGKLAVVGVSDWVTNEARQSPIFQKTAIVKRIYNWLNLNLFKPKDASLLRAELGLKTEDFVIIGVSQIWSDYKGLGRFIKLAEDRLSYKIYLVGRIPENTILPSNLISLGEINNPERLALLYNMADVFVNFSIQETFGKVSAEAVACGTPIVTNTITANPELCGEGCGKIVDISNWDDVLNAIDAISSEGKATYSKNCVQFAQDNFEKSGRLNDYFQLIKDIVYQ